MGYSPWGHKESDVTERTPCTSQPVGAPLWGAPAWGHLGRQRLAVGVRGGLSPQHSLTQTVIMIDGLVENLYLWPPWSWPLACLVPCGLLSKHREEGGGHCSEAPGRPLYAPKSSYRSKLVVLPKLTLTVVFLDLLQGQLGRGALLLPVPLPQTVRSTPARVRKAAGTGLPRPSLGAASALLLGQAALCLQAQGPGPAK